MAHCCTGSWRAPVYFTVSVILAFIAISTSMHSKTEQPSSPTKLNFHELSLNASKALRKAGFNVMATLLQVSPEIFLSSPNSTIFAIQDDAISNSSLPPWLLRNLLQYHTSPLNLPMKDLLKKPRGSCLPTLHRQKNIAITNIDFKETTVDINNVSVTHPDVFLAETISVHGVLEPFSSLDPEDVHQGWNSIQAPTCNAMSVLVSDAVKSTNMVEWSWIVRLLSSNGFVPFAIGLNSVLEEILKDYKGLNSVTIFAPPNLQSLTSPSPLLKRTVWFHILPQRLTYKELTALPAGTLLMTLVRDLSLEVAGTAGFKGGLIINGIEIVAPDIFTSKKFTVHGISRAFEVADQVAAIVSKWSETRITQVAHICKGCKQALGPKQVKGNSKTTPVLEVILIRTTLFKN
ncbi:hypothetical protein F8388_015418 [Cannabis sativa]|uniref:FAS1 domain-containing protein n=1 Tax=Cannabis sativa TaxID=3483 RepID=A0A7J6GJR9_CANSA|nr:hypothetical protein F8388_015418 [Cannabis sativa]